GTINQHQIFLIRQSWKHIEYLETLIMEDMFEEVYEGLRQ
ncbi:IS110 family transposase, partial [Butyricicoccus sp. 1XD8-22]